MLLREFLNDYYLSDCDIAESTLTSYKTSISLLEKWAGKPVSLKDLSDHFINKWLTDYQNSGVSPYSVKCRRASIRAVCNAAADSGMSSYRPGRLRKVRCPQTSKDIWTADEARTLIEEASKCTSRFRNTCVPKKYYFQAIFAVAWDSGLRLADITSIRTDDLRSCEFQVIMSKTGRLKRVVLNESTRRMCLLAYDKYCSDRKLVFPLWRNGSRHNKLRGLSVAARNIMRRAGLSASDGVFKKLRRSSITYAESISPGTGWVHAGHTKPDITIQHYINQSEAYRERMIPDPIV